MGFAVAEIARGGANKFGNFMGMLEFGAVDLDDHAGVAKEDFRGSFDDAGLAGAGGTEKKQIAHRAAGRVQAGAEDLVEVDKRLHAFFLADDTGTKRLVEIAGIAAADCRIQLLFCRCFHGFFLER
jgi:hypothetical protein